MKPQQNHIYLYILLFVIYISKCLAQNCSKFFLVRYFSRASICSNRSASSEQDNSDQSEHSEKSPLVSARLDNLARLFFSKSMPAETGSRDTIDSVLTTRLHILFICTILFPTSLPTITTTKKRLKTQLTPLILSTYYTTYKYSIYITYNWHISLTIFFSFLFIVCSFGSFFFFKYFKCICFSFYFNFNFDFDLLFQFSFSLFIYFCYDRFCFLL